MESLSGKHPAPRGAYCGVQTCMYKTTEQNDGHRRRIRWDSIPWSTDPLIPPPPAVVHGPLPPSPSRGPRAPPQMEKGGALSPGGQSPRSSPPTPGTNTPSVCFLVGLLHSSSPRHAALHYLSNAPSIKGLNTTFWIIPLSFLFL